VKVKETLLRRLIGFAERHPALLTSVGLSWVVGLCSIVFWGVGTIQPITDWRYSAISHRWPELSRDFKQTQIYDLCAFCGRPNSWTGVMLGLVGSLAGLLLYPICLIENKLNKRKAITNALKHALQRLVESPALQQKRVTEELVDDGTDISDAVREVMTSFLTNYADALQDFSNRFGKRIKPHQQQALDRLSGHTNEMLQQGDSSLLQGVGTNSAFCACVFGSNALACATAAAFD
jgi:gas vesicle protein